jgi:hypothetical protein
MALQCNGVDAKVAKNSKKARKENLTGFSLRPLRSFAPFA